MAEQYRLRARAVLRKARCTAALSHVSSLAEYGTPMWDVPLDAVHLTRFDSRAGRQDAGVVQHKGASYVGDLTVRNGVLISSPTRTALELTTILDAARSVVAINGLLNAKETSLAELCFRYERMTRWPDTLTTNLVLKLVDGRCESVGESRIYFMCWQHALPTPVLQYEVRRGATVLARLDMAWPEQRVWLEFDGKVKYSAFLRPGESPADVVFREKRREDMIREITGWICIRVTWADLAYPERLVARIRAAFAAQAAA